MNIESKPVAFAVISGAVILAGTIVTTFVPMLMPSTQPVSPYIKPYTAIEIEGRDIYIREGCNNCHTQTVRPLRTEVLRYGEYSKPEEYAYDRPHLWGSRRTGPDLARVGGKYPDSWHYRHFNNPRDMFPDSIMPAYGWLARRKLDTSYTYRKVQVLKLGYSKEEVKRQIEEFRKRVTSDDYPAKKIRDSVTPPELRGEISEMDALIAYIQKLGRDVKELVRKRAAVEASTEEALTNPYGADHEVIARGREIFAENCAACHGEGGKGDIGPDLTDDKWKYGGSDAEIFRSISDGRPEGMPSWKNRMSSDDIWKVISYIRSLGKGGSH